MSSVTNLIRYSEQVEEEAKRVIKRSQALQRELRLLEADYILEPLRNREPLKRAILDFKHASGDVNDRLKGY